MKTIRDFEELIEQTTPPMFGSANNSFWKIANLQKHPEKIKSHRRTAKMERGCYCNDVRNKAAACYLLQRKREVDVVSTPLFL